MKYSSKSNFPEILKEPFHEHFIDALKSGLSVIMAIKKPIGVKYGLYEIFPDGSRKLLKPLDPNMKPPLPFIKIT